MKHQNGFTLIELLVTMVILGILLVLGSVSLRGYMVNARDSTRRSNVESIVHHFESYYISGDKSQYASTPRGSYPPTPVIESENSIRASMPDIDPKILRAPDTPENTISLVAATNPIQTTSGVTPQPTVSQFVYQPIDRGNALCDSISLECSRFNIYFRLEDTNTVIKMTSKNQ